MNHEAAGYLAGSSKRTRVPPKGLKHKDKARWLKGYDNARRINGRQTLTRGTDAKCT